MGPHLTPTGQLEFGRVRRGYDPAEVDRAIDDLGKQLAQADVVIATLIQERDHLRTSRRRPVAEEPALDGEVMALRKQAHDEVAAARTEAQAILDKAFEDATNARRDFEIALAERRRRERANDDVWRKLDAASG